MEREKGLEPSTSTLATWRSSQLSYSRILFQMAETDALVTRLRFRVKRKPGCVQPPPRALIASLIMKIYTKKGDAGETGLYGNVRVPKDDLRIRVYGTLDELNAQLGLTLCDDQLPAEIRPWLLRIQGEIFQL